MHDSVVKWTLNLIVPYFLFYFIATRDSPSLLYFKHFWLVCSWCQILFSAGTRIILIL